MNVTFVVDAKAKARVLKKPRAEVVTEAAVAATVEKREG